LSSVASVDISNRIIDVVGARLEDTVQETVMKAIAEMSHTYFPKVRPNFDNDNLDISQIIIPPVRLHQLRTFLNNPVAHFTCPEQAVLLELMLLRTQSILAILGTGTGKTFAILMQAVLQKELVTIVVLPLSTLHDDLKRRALELQVPYSRWSPTGKFNANAQVISVSIEHLGFSEFVVYVVINQFTV
jgi:superfamily II DNA helicase RecQ